MDTGAIRPLAQGTVTFTALHPPPPSLPGQAPSQGLTLLAPDAAMGHPEGDGVAIRQSPTSAERAAFKKAAIEFESFFLFYMMKTMRQAIPKSDLIRSNATDTYKGMFDQEVSNLAAQRGGLGLAKALESQFFPPPLIRLSFSASLPIKVTEEEGL
jgi:hypothetical protein